MSAALLVVDLEGICPVERLDQIMAESPAYPQAQRWLTDEVNHVVQAMQAAHGFDAVRVSDSHASGSGEPTVLASELVAGAELFMLDDPYDAQLFDGVQAVACLGMHAAAGPEGFIPHTVTLHGALSAEGRSLTEADLVIELAAEAGAGVLFVSGDDVLERQLADRVCFVRTKIAQSVLRARALPTQEVWPALAVAAAGPPAAPEPLVPTAQTLELAFHSVWQADRAETAGARRMSERVVQVGGDSFRERYDEAVRVADLSGETVAGALRDSDAYSLRDDLGALLSRRSLVAPLPAAAPSKARLARIFQSLWTQTESRSEEHRALRALVLHMLEHHAPQAFAELDLGGPLAAALADLVEVPAALDPELLFEVAQARVDACFVRSERSMDGPLLDSAELGILLWQLETCGDDIFAFILGEMAALIGVEARVALDDRPYRDTDRTEDLYWLTHEFLIASRYLAKPLHRERFGRQIEELFLAVPWVLASQQVDLAAEMALCLQLGGEHDSAEHGKLLALLDEHTGDDGLVRDPSADDQWLEMADHATGAVLLALSWVRHTTDGNDTLTARDGQAER